MIKLSDYVMQFLKSKDIRHIFMLPGGGAMHLVDSLGKSGITYIACQHEQAASICAESYGQHTNHLGVALVTSGPGATNAITGLTAGWIDSTPMLFISGQAKRQDLVGDKGVRQVGSQEVNIVKMVESVTKYAVQLMEPTDVRYVLERAYYEATHERKGPVWIDIPLDVQAAMVDETTIKGYLPQEHTLPGGDIKKVLAEIRQSKKPLMLAGNGIISAGAESVFYQVISKLRIPVQTTWKSIDLMWDSHELYAGHPGALGDRGANFIIQDCDLLIAVGARLDNSITAFNEEKFATKARKIVVDIDPFELNKFNMPIEYKIEDDALHFLTELNDELQTREVNGDSDWLSWCRNIREKYPVGDAMPLNDEYISGYYFTACLSDALTEDDIVVPESSGITTEATIQSFKNKKGQKMKHAAGLGSMGFGLPYSIGACLANDKRRTVLIDGDGAIQLNIQELQTLITQWLPVKIFIWDNQGYASIRAMQNKTFAGNYVACDASSGMKLPDMIQIANAYGIKTFSMTHNEDVVGTIQKVLATDGPCLCILKVSPDEVVNPKVMARVGEDGNMIAGELDKMWPFEDEVKG